MKTIAQPEPTTVRWDWPEPAPEVITMRAGGHLLELILLHVSRLDYLESCHISMIRGSREQACPVTACNSIGRHPSH